MTGVPFQGGARWRFESVDGTSLTSVSSYITDAFKLGMSVGDIVEQWNSSGGPAGTGQITEFAVLTVRSTTASAGAGSADLSPGRAATS